MKISIIIPTYNYAQYIVHAIESVVSLRDWQQDIEIIIIDDGSTDDTRKVLQPWLENGTIHYHFQENKGKAAATRKGIELANGDIIFNLDADDYFLPGKIEKTIDLFEQYPKLVHVASPAKITYEDGRSDEVEQIPVDWLDRVVEGKELLHFFFSNRLLFGGGSTFAARASVIKQMQWDDEVDMYTDEWLLIETLLKGDSYLTSDPMSVWRVHGGNYSGATALQSRLTKLQRMEKSSAAILQLLEKGTYPAWLVKIYRLKHQVRRLVWLEDRRKKSGIDIIRFVVKGILGGHSVRTLKKYHAFNRLLPSWIKTVVKG